MYYLTVVECLGFSRPSGLNLRCCTTRFPNYQKLGDDTSCTLSQPPLLTQLNATPVHQWMQRFTHAIMPQVLEVGLGNSTDYNAISRLVGLIEKFEVPPLLAWTSQKPKNTTPGLLFQRATMRTAKAICTLLSHMSSSQQPIT
jgi:hypothetical protein